jgi:hypothetical protein
MDSNLDLWLSKRRVWQRLAGQGGAQCLGQQVATRFAHAVVPLEATLADDTILIQHEHARITDPSLIVSDADTKLGVVGVEVLVQDPQGPDHVAPDIGEQGIGDAVSSTEVA